MNIRKATMNDLDEIAAVEAVCFPKEEAASKTSIQKRLSVYPDYFWVLEDNGKIAAYINGMATNEPNLRDEMFDDANLHDDQGAWQMIFSVSTAPEYRRQGYAEKVMNQVITDSKVKGRKGLVLTCKDKLVHYYAKFGFVNEGVSESTHGGAVWYDMRLTF